MARQSGTHTITGTIDHLCFYKMEGKFYVRQKSSLTRKRVKTDVAFANTMQYAKLLGKASKIASAFYKSIPAEKKLPGLYKRLTGMVMQLLKEGTDEAVIVIHLQQTLFPETVMQAKSCTEVSAGHTNFFADALLETIFAEPANLQLLNDQCDEGYARLKDYGFV